MEYEKSFVIELTTTQKLLIYGLKQYPISEENQEAVYLFLYKDEEKMREMIKFLALNLDATEDQIMEKLTNILEEEYTKRDV